MSDRHREDPWAISEDGYPARDGARERLRFLAGYAVLAPSVQNTQPWRFRLAGERLELAADRTRALPVSDPDDRELVLSCGAALFHLRLALRRFGHAGEVVLWPDPADPDLLARVGRGAAADPTPEELAEFAAIPQRRTHRGRLAARPVPTGILTELQVLATEEGAWLHLAEAEPERAALAALIQEADRAQAGDPRFRRELLAWVHERRRATGDGLPDHAPEVRGPAIEEGPLVVRTFDRGDGQAARGGQLAEGSPVLAVLGTSNDTPRAWLEAGQALGRMLLRAQSLGLYASYLNQPVEVPDTRARLPELLGREGHPQLVLRFGYGEAPPPTPRRPLAEVFD